jgi:hypothetical protein
MFPSISPIFILSCWFIQFKKEFKIEKSSWAIFSAAGPALHRPLTHSRVWSQPVTTHASQSLPPGAHLLGSFSPLPSPAPADPYRRRDFGQTATRASGQGCLMPPCHIPSPPAADCGPSRPLVLLCAVVPLSLVVARRCCARRNAVAKHLLPRDPRNAPWWFLCACIA